MSSSTNPIDIDINSLTQEVNKEVSKTKENNAQSYFSKCFKTPMMYMTSVPFAVCVLIYFCQPEYIYDTDKLTKKKILNTQRLITLIVGGTVIANLFIHYYLIKKCNMKIFN